MFQRRKLKDKIADLEIEVEARQCEVEDAMTLVRGREVYVVAFTGGYDDPSFAAKATLDAAESLAMLWSHDLGSKNGGEEVRVLRVGPIEPLDPLTLTTHTVVVYWYNEDLGKVVESR